MAIALGSRYGHKGPGTSTVSSRRSYVTYITSLQLWLILYEARPINCLYGATFTSL
jgi:hypothetical protein